MSREDCVFVVDDDPSVRNGLTLLLRTAGHDARNFASASEFLDAVEPDTSGCLVLDARMPGFSGKEFHASLEACHAHLTVIIVSADDTPEARREAQHMKAALFFRKPVDGMALLDAVNWSLCVKHRADEQVNKSKKESR